MYIIFVRKLKKPILIIGNVKLTKIKWTIVGKLLKVGCRGELNLIQ